MKQIARIVSRGKGIAGLFMPVGEGLEYGLYDVIEIMGEYEIRKVGEPANPKARQTGIDLDSLMSDRPNSVFTKEEIRKYYADSDW